MDLDQITQETLEAVKKAQTSGISTGTGIVGVNLAGLVSLIPVNTPFRNMVPRKGAPEGAKFAQWRALLNINNSQPNPAVGFDYAGGLALIDEQDIQSPFQPVAMGYTITQDAVDLAKGYADAHALATLNTLNQLLIGEEKLLLGGQSFALPIPGTVTLAASTSGGSIATSTVYVRVTARTLANYFYGGSTVGSTEVSVAVTGPTGSVVASWASVKGAAAYDVWVGSAAGAEHYMTTVTVPSVTITSVPTVNNTAPALPDLSTTVPATIPTVDGSASANEFNGLLASLAGDYSANGTIVTPGTGTVSSGAVWVDNAAGTLTLSGGSIQQIDQVFLDLYQNVRLSPSAIMMSAGHANDIGAKVLGSPSAVTYLQPNDTNGRGSATVGGAVGRIINKAAGGVPVDVEVQPHLPDGTIIFRTDTVPFPGSNIGRTIEVETLRDMSDFTYGANRNAGVAGGGPRVDGEVRSVECLKNLAPVAMAVLQGVARG